MMIEFKRAFKALAFVIFIFTSENILAGNSMGLVTDVLAGADSPFFFSAGSHQSKPSCSTQGDHWAIDTATPGGKAMQATILTAYALKKKISISGKGVCDIWGDRESVGYLVIVE